MTICERSPVSHAPESSAEVEERGTSMKKKEITKVISLKFQKDFFVLCSFYRFYVQRAPPSSLRALNEIHCNLIFERYLHVYV